MKFEDIDLVDTLRRIMNIHTEHYKEDFELDTKLLFDLAASQSPEDKHLLWMSRPNGTYLLREREVYVEDTYENKVWEYYHDQTRDPILAYSVEIIGRNGNEVRGNLIELDYAAHVEKMKQQAVKVETMALTFADSSTYYLPFRSYWRDSKPLEEKHGEVKEVSYLPDNTQELEILLRRERSLTSSHAKIGNIEDYIHRLEVQHGISSAVIPEKLAPLSLEAQTAYNAIKEANPEAIVCFAQRGYFEIYGEDAKRAAPILGAKLLMKELEGVGKVAVTGFRQEQWVSETKKLWGQDNDVLLSQPGDDGKQEVVKHLRFEDYIPIGMIVEVDGKTARVESVDFAQNDVRLTDLTDKQHPKEFHESVSFVRSCVENAPAEKLWEAIDRRVQKPTRKSSVLAKLKEHSQVAPDKAVKKPERVKKTKSKEMEL